MDTQILGGESIPLELYIWITLNIPEGKTILELGSGDGTRTLCQKWNIYSVEDNPRWLDHAPSTYIHAPQKNGWYDADVLKRNMPESYDMILVDGPRSPERAPTRHRMLLHLHLFNLDVPILVDDVHRSAEKRLLDGLAAATGRTPEVIECGDKSFGVI